MKMKLYLIALVLVASNCRADDDDDDDDSGEVTTYTVNVHHTAPVVTHAVAPAVTQFRTALPVAPAVAQVKTVPAVAQAQSTSPAVMKIPTPGIKFDLPTFKSYEVPLPVQKAVAASVPVPEFKTTAVEPTPEPVQPVVAQPQPIQYLWSNSFGIPAATTYIKNEVSAEAVPSPLKYWHSLTTNPQFQGFAYGNFFRSAAPALTYTSVPVSQATTGVVSGYPLNTFYSLFPYLANSPTYSGILEA